MSACRIRPRPGKAWQGLSAEGQDIVGLAWGDNFPGDFPQRIRSLALWEYMVVANGVAKLLIAEQVIPVRRGDVFIFGNVRPHGWNGTLGQPLNMLVWAWRNPPYLPPLQVPPDGWLRLRVSASAQRHLRQIHIACRNELRALNELSRWTLQRHRLDLELVLAQALRQPKTASENGDTFAEALRWMAAHLNHANPQEALCKHLLLSPATLNRLFQRSRYQSFAVVFHHMRMRQAQEWLNEKRRSVKEVAMSLGYKHPNDFSRAFKKATGYAPSAGRRLTVVNWHSGRNGVWGGMGQIKY